MNICDTKYSVTVNQVKVATAKPSKWQLQISTYEPLV
jgi:hypothetical protein